MYYVFFFPVVCRSLCDIGVNEITLEDLGDAEAAAEGSNLGVWCFQEFKETSKKKCCPSVFPFEGNRLVHNNKLIKKK